MVAGSQPTHIHAWDNIKVAREAEIEEFARFYQADILHLIDGAPFDAAVLPDSFTVRLRIVGKGLKDFILNYPYIFEVVEPEDIALPQREAVRPAELPPARSADRTRCQRTHRLCNRQRHPRGPYLSFNLPSTRQHRTVSCPAGTQTTLATLCGRAATAPASPEQSFMVNVVPKNGTPQLPFWIQNARVLDENNSMPVEMFPPQAVRAAVERFHRGPRKHGYSITRLMHTHIAAPDTCLLGRPRSICLALPMMCCLSKAQAICRSGHESATWRKRSSRCRA